jgi:succinoglycan biosynthesis transport protein ExoP
MILVGVVKNPLDRPAEDRILENYYERLLVYPVGKSRIVAIEFRSKDPELAAKGANTVAELYLSIQGGAKIDTARNASTWLGSNIEALRKRVAEAEAKVEEFRSKTGLFVGSNNAPINAQQLSELSTQLAQARTAKADSEAKAKLIRDMIKGGRAFEIPDVANNELIRRLIEQRITLRAQLALELRTLLPEHPRIKELNAQVNDLEAQIRGAAERTVRTLENDAKIAGSRVETLQSAIDTQKGVVVQANEAEVQLRAFEREAKAQRDQLESYLTRYREATARDAENAVPPDARIVSRSSRTGRPSRRSCRSCSSRRSPRSSSPAAGWSAARSSPALALPPPCRPSTRRKTPGPRARGRGIRATSPMPIGTPSKAARPQRRTLPARFRRRRCP